MESGHPLTTTNLDLPWTLEDPSGGAPATGVMLYRSVGNGPFEPLGLQPLTPGVIRVPQPPPLVRQRYLVRGIDGAGNYEPPRDAADIREVRNIDVSGDGAIDFNDILAFLNLFNAEDPLADLTENGVVDFNDFLEFLNLYTAV